MALIKVIFDSKIFLVSKETLTMSPYFSRLLEDDATKTLFVDRDSDVFERILVFLRYGRIVPSTDDFFLYTDIAFYGLSSLLLKWQPHCTLDYNVAVVLPPLAGAVLSVRFDLNDTYFFGTHEEVFLIHSHSKIGSTSFSVEVSEVNRSIHEETEETEETEKETEEVDKMDAYSYKLKRQYEQRKSIDTKIYFDLFCGTYTTNNNGSRASISLLSQCHRVWT